MRRFAALLVLLGLTLAWTACGGGNSSVGPVTKIVITPATLSLSFGQAQQITATPQDANGNSVLNQTVTFASSNTALADVSTNGLVCAGKWDNTSNPVVCTPATTAGPANQPAANITASVGSIQSAAVPVFVHAAVDRVTISAASTPDCQSQGDTLQLSAQAFSNGTDVTSTVGPFTWTTANATIATVDTTGLVTAVNPGQTQVTGSLLRAGSDSTLGAVNSTPLTYTTCPVKSIALHVSGGTATSASAAAGTTQQLAVDVVDSKGKTLTAVPVQFESSNSPSSTVAITSGFVSVTAPGTATIVSSCTPPACNNGLYPVYSNPFVMTATGTSTTTVYVASPTSTSLIPIDTGTNAVGTAATLPFNPNSMIINPAGTKLFMGSATALMVYDIASNTTTSSTLLSGKMLAISPDGSLAVMSDTTAGKVFFFNTTNGTLNTYNVAGATAAAFSPDNYRAYVTGGNSLTVFSQNATVRTFTINNVNDVTYLGQGSFGYLAGGPSNVSVYATCTTGGSETTGIATGGRPARIATLRNGTQVLAADSPNLDVIDATTDGSTGFNAATTPGSCAPPSVTTTFTAFPFAGVGGFTANQVIVTPDNSKAYISASDVNALLAFDVAAKTTRSIPLVGTGITGATTGGVVPDSTSLYVGVVGKNEVHRIDVKQNTDATQIPVSISPDLVVVRPK